MSLEALIEIRTRSIQLDVVEDEVRRCLRGLTGNPQPPPEEALTKYQTGLSKTCFLQHWCGANGDVLAQYQTLKSPPHKLACHIFLSMKGKPSSSGQMPDYTGDSVDDIKREVGDLVVPVWRSLVHMRPWYVRLTRRWDARILPVEFLDPIRPTGVVGKMPGNRDIAKSALRALLPGAAPVLGTTIVAAWLNGWDFLDERAAAATYAAMGYLIVLVLWLIIDIVRTGGKLRFNDE